MPQHARAAQQAAAKPPTPPGTAANAVEPDVTSKAAPIMIFFICNLRLKL